MNYQDLPLFFLSIVYATVPLFHILIAGFLGGRVLKNIRDIMKVDAIIPDAPAWNYYTYLEVLKDLILMCLLPVLAVLIMISALALVPETSEFAIEALRNIFSLSLAVAKLHALPISVISIFFFLSRCYNETVEIKDGWEVIEI